MIVAAEIDNKIGWLGEFPAHWQVLRIKNLFQEMDSRSETGAALCFPGTDSPLC